jgi:type IV pilus assembly protein PilW
MTLVELMVAVTIGLGITLAITSVMIASENHKRVTTSTNDAQQTGTFSYYALDKVIRGAGSAIAESALPSDVGVLGCHLNATTTVAGTIFPRPAAFPQPFAGFLGGAAGNLNVAPLLIGQNQSQGGSDVLMVMGGSGSAGGVSRQITGGGNATTATLDNSVGFAAGDLVLVSQSGTPDCLLEQVDTIAPPASPTLNFGGGAAYYTAAAVTTTMATLAGSTSSYVTPLGNAPANNIQFLLFGVDNNNTLVSYDLLRNLQIVGLSGGDAVQSIADGVVSLNALYGLDTDGDGKQDTWAAPGAPTDATWDINTVMNSQAKIKQIVSVRVALVVRGEYYDKNNNNAVSQPTLTIFNGLKNGLNGTGVSLARNINLTALDQQFRYRVFEFTVPLRNMLIVAGAP